VYKGEQIQMTEHDLLLSGIPDNEDRQAIHVHVNPKNNLPTSLAYAFNGIQAAVAAFNSTVSSVHEANVNLNDAEKELLRWHQRLGHISYKKVQFLMRTGALAKSEKQKRLHATASRLDNVPLCAACQFGKQRQRSAPGMKHVTDKQVSGALKSGHLYPGQCVSADHFICSTRGRLFTSKGKSKANDMYTGGCLFVDHCSTHIDCQFQTHLNTHQTLIAKEQFELMCRDVGVIPQEYLTNNGSAFSSKDYTAKLREFAQIYRFAGVGAHHHNGIAERAIQTVMSIARTMMLHAAIHWPETADPALWPMAVQHAVFLWNHMPDPTTGVSPADVFTKTRWEQRKFLDLHVWGCPVYVLEKSIADGKKLPRWQPRSHRTMHMGLSPLHASTVPTVLNLDTGAITPQFQVMFDDWFSTVTSTISEIPNFTEDVWQKMFGESEWQYFGPDDDEDGNSPND
jgi:transposase InsO family protein